MITALPLDVVVGAATILGLLFGSFLNVVVYRVPAGLSLLHPGSQCVSCARHLTPFELVPVVSWLALGGRCRTCRAPISWRYPLLELALGALWGVLAWRLWPLAPLALPAYLALGFVTLALAVIDAQTKRLPNRITYPAFATLVLLLGVASVVGHDPARMERAALAAVIVGVAFLVLALLVPGGMGLGDVKLVPTLALALGWLSWSVLAEGFMFAFVLGGMVGIALLAFGRAHRKSRLPFGPWLVSGTLLAIVIGPATTVLLLR